ncbi:uncharacterized protein GIQ15_03794 [Arthroderma uncinatum]|uniref:uncharacterized protein n=1 Tax=Arthroderma uncinatum TaxID=74035 RepID=UPI00144A62B1|nr:uncharacterized protein GIQ15_03794 [Arthroderma uncinatum]KAF3481035.1 hypothetical protein GIQ15_03794 [Arthroderma uncinatum]
MAATQSLLAWYASLKSRTVDLVGDYAGDELFIIEGDSLLAHTFADNKLDFNPGFQLLHAAYILENFLHRLRLRKCNFHIVFFQEHAPLCVPDNMPDGLHARCYLARECMIQHLQRNLAVSTPSIKVKVFDSYRTREFMDYLSTSGTYFLMCHDGVFSDMEHAKCDEDVFDNEDNLSSLPDLSGSTNGLDDESSLNEDIKSVPAHGTKQAIGFRLMIIWFVRYGYNVALLNVLECRDTKVMTMIVEGTAVEARQASQYPLTIVEKQMKGSHAELGPSSDSSNDTNMIVDGKLDNRDRNTHKALVTDLSTAAEVEAIPELSDHPVHGKLLQELSRVLKSASHSELSQRDLAVLLALSLMYKCGIIDGGDTKEAKAMLLHNAILLKCRVSYRTTQVFVKSDVFLTLFSRAGYQVLKSNIWNALLENNDSKSCDLADLLDGRLFHHLLNSDISHITSDPSVISRVCVLATWLERLCGLSVDFQSLNAGNEIQKDGLGSSEKPKQSKGTELASSQEVAQPILPFSHPVFNAHLEPVHLSVDEQGEQCIVSNTSRIFQELSHWHNHRRPIGSKIHDTKMTGKDAFFANRRNQFFMAEMADYAASLTNAIGGVLNPETIFLQSAKDAKKSASSKDIFTIRPKANEKKGSAKSGGKINTSAKDLAIAANEKKHGELIDKQLRAWRNVKVNFHGESDLATRFAKAKRYLADRPSDSSVMLRAEISNYLLSILVELWTARCTAGERDRSLHIAAFIWDMVCRIAKMKEGLTPEIVKDVTETTRALRLPDVGLDIQPIGKSSQGIQPASLRKDVLDIGLSPHEFQLVHAAPFFDRNMGSAADPRVRDFEPDEWQRNVLDEIDANRSLFVVAPTSAGKTFISFYAMKKVLQENDDGVLVYVAPTKALVNQVAAEIQARFSKNFRHGGKSVWGIHTRDYRINNATGCQILVTVPHILQIMLLAPANATSWSGRVKRIIFDEIHCIGQVDDGVVWEQLLLLAPCPIIALSATVGNPREFYKWLSTTQKANGIDLTMIEHRHRYSDLRKYIYKPPKKFYFGGLPDSTPFPPMGLDNALGMAFMHPVACLGDRSRGMPEDLTLEARDCWLLWSAMAKYQTPDFPVDKALDPAVVLPKIIRKVDIVNWEAKLKPLLKTWMEDRTSPYELVFKELEFSVRSADRPEVQVSSYRKSKESELAHDMSENYMDSTLPLICSLQQAGALPALFFNYDRSACEAICENLLTQLEQAEDAWKTSNPAWKAKLAGWEAWKASRERQAKKNAPNKAKKKGKAGDDDMSQEDRMRDTTGAEPSMFESFDPDAPVDGFHLTDVKKLTPSELEEHAKELRRRYVPERLITALRRGIGVHHAGMNRKYRQVCEILFRKGYLRVVIATGTLALGINMPCKTVVFSGDSIFLTALNFRQAAGRAGRRGFDMLGNVVFQDVPYSKVCRLLSSRLPDLNGHFPITTSLVLRLFILLHESKQATNARKMVDSLLSCPHIYLGGGEARDTVLHHLRFSIEYLRRNHLLGPGGAPLNFAGCVSHLYFVENSSFAFHALLKDGYFHGLCQNLGSESKGQLHTLMLVMSHLFGRQYLRPGVLNSQKKATKKSTSMIVLPPLPHKPAAMLRRNNREILRIYSTYAKTFVDQHITEPDCTLPLTKMQCGGDEALKVGGPGSPSPVKYTSAFYALSGHRDKWENVSDLCDTVRSGVWLEKAVVPYIGLYPEEGKVPLNAYLYDFFRHGNVHALEKDNGIRKGDIWFLLNDFSLVLATIVTSFENFLKLSPGTDADILDAIGSGDAHEGEVDLRAMQEATENMKLKGPGALDLRMTATAPTSPSSPAPITTTRKKKVADSWEDEAEDDEADEKAAIEAERPPPPEEADGTPAASDRGNAGIYDVLRGFKLLQAEFNQKFKAMWA